jgi:teichoic acid transport system ATP-binding protein
VRTYSSGMFVRLAFAVAISVDPDILLVDEALAVGDMNFQAKCFRKLAKIREDGKTVIFVTHALDTVIRYCDKAIVLEKGRLVAEADPKKAVDAYKQIMAGCALSEAGTSTCRSSSGSDCQSGSDRQSGSDMLSYGNKKAQIVDYGISDEAGRRICLLENGRKFTITMRVKFQADIADPIFAFTIKDLKGLEVTGTNTEFKKNEKETKGPFRKGDMVEVKFDQVLNMQSGKYALSLGCVGSDENGLAVYHRLYDAVLFEVSSSFPMVGLYDLDSRVTVDLVNS